MKQAFKMRQLPLKFQHKYFPGYSKMNIRYKKYFYIIYVTKHKSGNEECLIFTIKMNAL